jgi:hypothetical protein
MILLLHYYFLTVLLTTAVSMTVPSASSLKPLEGAIVRATSAKLGNVQRLNANRAVEEILGLLKANAKNYEDLVAKYFENSKFNELAKNQREVVKIYDKINLHLKTQPVAQAKFMNRLRELAFNRGFPEKISTVPQFLALRNSRPETIEYILESPGFQGFSKSIPLLDLLVKEITKERKNGGGQVWNKIVPKLRDKLADLWANEV